MVNWWWCWDRAVGIRALAGHIAMCSLKRLLLFFVRPTVVAYTVPTMVISVRAMERHLWMAHDAAIDT